MRDDLQQLHFVHGGEVMHAHYFVGTRTASCNLCYGNGAGIGGDDAMLWHHSFQLLDHTMLNLYILENSLNNNVGCLEVVVV